MKFHHLHQPLVMLVKCLPILLLYLNIGHGVIVLDGVPVDVDGGEGCVSAPAINGLIANRDPLLSLSLFEPEEREEADLLFNELERILSPAPDNDLDDVTWNSTDPSFLVRTYEWSPHTAGEYAPFTPQEPSGSSHYQQPESGASTSFAGGHHSEPDTGSFAEYAVEGTSSSLPVHGTTYATSDYYDWPHHPSSSYHSMSDHSSVRNFPDECPSSAKGEGQERMETSGDSAVSSMSSSGRLSSSSEHGWVEREDVSSHNHAAHLYGDVYRHSHHYPHYSHFGQENGQDPSLPPNHPHMANHTYSSPEPTYTEPKSRAPPLPSSSSYQATMTSLTQAKRVHSSKKTSVKSVDTDDGSESVLSDEDAQFSRDERRARQLNIPIPTCDIINLPIDEFNERLTKYDLTEAQLSLIRDIRRRGKNKVAAQNCRKRKMDQILGLQGDVDRLFAQKESLEQQQAQLLYLRELARDKYSRLYNFIRDSRGDAGAGGAFTSQGPPGDPRDPAGSLTVQESASGDNSNSPRSGRHPQFVMSSSRGSLLNSTSSFPSVSSVVVTGHAVAAGGPAVMAEIELE